MQNQDHFERPNRGRESAFDISCAERDYIEHVVARPSLFGKVTAYLALALVLAAFFNGHQIMAGSQSGVATHTQTDLSRGAWPSASFADREASSNGS